MNRIPSVTELAQHVRDIARAYNVIICDPTDMPHELAISFTGSRYGKQNSVLVRAVTDEVTYCIALHEIGHCAHPTGSVRERATLHNLQLHILEEESAWEWAERNALMWTPTMQHVKLNTIQSYYHAATAQEDAQRRKEIQRLRAKETVRDFFKRVK